MPRRWLFWNGGAGGAPVSSDRVSLREWWHDLLRKYDKYPLYAIFLVLPSDIEAIRYVDEFGRELSTITGHRCLFVALEEERKIGFQNDAALWGRLVHQQADKGHSLTIAKAFGIPMAKFPCLLLFESIHSSEYIEISLVEMSAEQISKKLRSIFDEVYKALDKGRDPITVLNRNRNKVTLRRKGVAILSQVKSLAGMTLETVMKTIVEASIK